MTSRENKKKRLGDLLVQENLITQKQLDQAVEVQRVKGGRLGDILVELNFATEDLVLSVLAKRAGIPFVSSLSVYGKVPAEILALVPADIARQQSVFPLAREGNTLTVALSDPFVELNAVDDLKIQTGFEIKMVLASEKEIQKAVERDYAVLRTTNAALSGSAVSQSDVAVDPQMTTILNALIDNGAKLGADHIFLEPGPASVHVRYRVKGTLEKKPDLPLHHQAPLVAHIKNLARLNVAERWLPQDGRLRGQWEGHALDVKVSTLPTVAGEKVVLSLLDSARAMPLDLAKLGLEPGVLEHYQKLIEAKEGLLVVAGPSGAGKTATLYATLNALNRSDRHLLTIEDPVERFVDGVTQMQVRADVRVTLASGLHILRRQDPDVLMVTEISDLDTAEVAVDAASGCLVLSSVVAPDALGAIQKLVEMGVPPSLLAGRLVGVLAQRLVRTICPNCREAYTLSLRELMAAGVGEKEIRGAKRAESFTVHRGRGCGQCLATGYIGAVAVFEVCFVNDNIRRLIAERASPALLARETSERVTLREAAVKKVLAGETTVEEALRVG
ncbi:MAG: Flp pilus assembly complex ATPase component TadA [Elusimicrobia bacterium]|nr:Flp pilus assembly complex ATPase component TadA [Elusimicrobiota bacterium]